MTDTNDKGGVMDCKNHTDAPCGYIQWHEWARKKAKTHKQLKCHECGLYKIWIRRAQNEKI
jgi:hypothetical protein